MSNKLLSSNQHGFLPRRSSSTQLLQAISNWRQAQINKQSVNIVYTDLAKAFDKVSHSKLLEVIYSYGICGDTYNWLKSYLTDRLQCVELKNIRSSPLSITSGVPQGSVVGPLLFLIYIDDLSKESSPNSTVCLFADDAKIYSSDAHDLQDSLYSISNFFKTRQLQLAPEKCELLTVGKCKSATSFELEGISINQADSVKDLGVWINHDLKWETHVNKISKKAYQRANHILKSFRSTNVWTYLKAYKAYVRPILEYATTIWSPYLLKDKLKVERVQRFFTRKICRTCRIPYTSYSHRLYMLGIKTLEYRRVEIDLMFLYKIYNGLLDVPVSNFFTPTTNEYNTRSHNKCLKSNLSQTTLSISNFFSNRCTPVWNSLPPNIIESPNYNIFRTRLKKFDLHTIANLYFENYSVAKV